MQLPRTPRPSLRATVLITGLVARARSQTPSRHPIADTQRRREHVREESTCDDGDGTLGCSVCTVF